MYVYFPVFKIDNSNERRLHSICFPLSLCERIRWADVSIDAINMSYIQYMNSVL